MLGSLVSTLNATLRVRDSLSQLQFPHLSNGNNSTYCLMGFFRI